MGDPPLRRGLLLGLCTVLLAFNFSSATPQTERIVAVVGNSECLDCSEKSINTEEAVKGLHVSIQCKTGNGLYETKGEGLLDKSGSFDVQLPSTVLGEDGELKDECFAQLRSGSEAACPENENVGVDQSTIVLKSKENGKHTFAVKAGKLPFSSVCTSAFKLLFKKLHHKSPPYHKDLHPYHKLHPIHKEIHNYLHHKSPPAPVSKSTPAPSKSPPAPVSKSPPVPEYKPPIVEKPFPPFPMYKKPHLHPKLEHPIIHKKPLPPMHKFPPIYKKPPSPIPEFKFPPKPEFPKKKFPAFPPIKENPIP